MKYLNIVYTLLFILMSTNTLMSQTVKKANQNYIPEYYHLQAAFQYPGQAYSLLLKKTPPYELSRLNNLQYLYISECSIDSINLNELGYAKKLHHLAIAYSKVNKLSFSKNLKDELVFLNLSGTQITNMDVSIAAISSLVSLETLFIPGCGFSNFYDSWMNLSKLKNLQIGYEDKIEYNFESAIKNISKLKYLERLSINSSNLSEFPKSFKYLKNISTIGFQNCLNLDLDYIITSLKPLNISGLELKYSKIVSFPESIISLKNLSSLDLSHNEQLDIQQALSVLCQLKNLEELNLSYCVQTKTDIVSPTLDDLAKISTLKKIDFTKNKEFDSQYLWSVLGQLYNLEEIILADVPGQIFPDIHNLSKLKSLDITYTGPRNMENISAFPSSLENLKYSKSNLDSFPTQIINTPSLISVNLHKNDIMEVPEEISQMKNLVHLDLSYNQVAVLPESIKELSGTLKYLNLIGSPVGRNPIEVSRIRRWLPNTEVFEGR